MIDTNQLCILLISPWLTAPNERARTNSALTVLTGQDNVLRLEQFVSSECWNESISLSHPQSTLFGEAHKTLTYTISSFHVNCDLRPAETNTYQRHVFNLQKALEGNSLHYDTNIAQAPHLNYTRLSTTPTSNVHRYSHTPNANDLDISFGGFKLNHNNIFSTLNLKR